MENKFGFCFRLLPFLKNYSGNSFLRQKNALTLTELVVSVVLLGIVLLAIQVIGDVSRDRLMTSERKVRTQNEASFILDHMTRNLQKAIGSNALPGVGVISDNSIRVRKDWNENGVPDDDVSTFSWLAYQYDVSTHELTYTANCQSEGRPWPVEGEVISNKVEAFRFNYDQLSNFVDLEVTTCYVPQWSTPVCSDPANPSITMRTRVFLPQISCGPNS